MGEVSAHILLHPKLTLAEMKRFASADLLRSIYGRLRIYTDDLSHMSSEENKARIVSVTTPPRRVYYKPFAESIVFSDFLFGDENADTVISNAKRTFGVTVAKSNVSMNVEKCKFVIILDSNHYLESTHISLHSALA